MSDAEKHLRQLLADHHAAYQRHNANAERLLDRLGECTCEQPCDCPSDDQDRADAATESQLALAASNAMQALAVLIAREPA